MKMFKMSRILIWYGHYEKIRLIHDIMIGCKYGSLKENDFKKDLKLRKIRE